MAAMQYYFRCASLFLLGLYFTGCCCTPKGGAYCLSNTKAGIPIIICQPESRDVFVGDAASFSVDVDLSNCRYEWYRESVDVNGVVTQVPLATKQGGLTSTLTLSNLQLADSGQYFCSIVSEVGGQTRTRDAELTVHEKEKYKEDSKIQSKPQFLIAGSTNIGNPVIQLSTRALPTTSSAGGVSCGSSTFNVTTTQRFTVVDSTLARLHSPANANTCSIHLEKWNGVNWIAVPLANWFGKWQAPNFMTTPACIGGAGGTVDPSFPLTYRDADYIFLACFVSNEPPGENLKLTVTWTP